MKKILTVLLASAFILMPQSFTLAAEVEVAGWLPYWRVDQSVEDAQENLEKIDTLHPFVYSVQEDGTIKDLGNLGQRKWTRLFREARSEDVEIIPTIMWSDGGKMHEILSDEDQREDHVENIVDLVDDENFDGIDIDYEAKRAETKEYFSMFLEKLKEELDDKILTCTVEARTPPDSLYAVVPFVIEYANDYKKIGRHCDRIEIMAYDLGRADIKLNSENKGMPYAPVSDVDWVEKVVKLAIKEGLPKDKIMLAVPTYGYEYEMLASPEQYHGYKRLWSLNPGYGVTTSKENNIIPSRDNGGEISFSYFASSSPYRILSSLPVPAGTATGNVAATQALLFANATGWSVPFNYMVWSDADAIDQKIDLVEKYDLRGISIFKIDGGEDPEIWNKI